MAIGEASYFNNGSDNNTTRKSNLEFSYYSRYSFLSADKSVSMRFEFRSGLMQIKLYQKNGENWGSDPAEIIYLSSTKAKMLSGQITKFKEYIANNDIIDENVAFGVNGGMNEKVAFIAFHSNANKEVLITVGKFDGNGTITESLTYQSSKEFNYGLDWNNLNSMDLTKSYYNYLELDMIHNMVEDFSRNMSGALGYSVHDLGRYDLGRVLGKLDPIYDKLGIERLQGNYNKSRGTNNFLNSAGSSESHTTTTLDDLMGM
jgi:hypothetical protein